ncbi:hypothetical protein [Acinetobacter sp. ANC 5502]
MAAETDVQFFSHLNAGCPQLTNDWGCMINLLDACLVNGVSLPTVSSVTVATGGNITVNFVSFHSVLLFQCVTLVGFAPDTLNGKYRVIGIPSTTQLTLSSDLNVQSATGIGTAKLSPLGYQIIHSANTKRVYRALNPSVNHPYIRVDESTGTNDGTGIYADTYAKYAMVGLLASMDSIDDYENEDVLQLPFDPSNPSRNWQIAGQNTDCVRGWSRWYWAKRYELMFSSENDINAPSSGCRYFTLCGNSDAFYLFNNLTPDISAQGSSKFLHGCGLYNAALDESIIPNWFLMTTLNDVSAGTGFGIIELNGGVPLAFTETASKFFTSKYNLATPLSTHATANPILPTYNSGYSNLFSATNLPALEIPFYDSDAFLRGSLKHIYYAGKKGTTTVSTPMLADKSMYLWDSGYTYNFSEKTGGFLFYLGEM